MAGEVVGARGAGFAAGGAGTVLRPVKAPAASALCNARGDAAEVNREGRVEEGYMAGDRSQIGPTERYQCSSAVGFGLTFPDVSPLHSLRESVEGAGNLRAQFGAGDCIRAQPSGCDFLKAVWDSRYQQFDPWVCCFGGGSS